ncbi:ester cyclase [Roseovarius rhodophyticola]|uniref:Ester cyclase n=1 Tax=Roseovarius rhodophyticola TaxID=3080827 RepID=A0ABZ2TBY2_9RHOB|nr:ester cyclase [Roseovarius sp. W115]MDV2930932.1 ester cyclase [Roseovarius sp. W115]
MTRLTSLFLAGTQAAAPVMVQADDLDVIKSFYADLLTTPADVTSDAVRSVVAEDWVSIPTPRGGPGAEGLLKTLKGFGAVIPDLAWAPQEILQDGNRYIVRGKATGTPAVPFLGVEPTGKRFEIMSIDIHTIEDGKIVQSYHVEEWLSAQQQLLPDD